MRQRILQRIRRLLNGEPLNSPTLLGPHHAIEGIQELERFFAHLADAMPTGSTLHIEGPCFAADVLAEYRAMQSEPEVTALGGWLSPKTSVFRLPLTSETGRRLDQLLANHAEPEIAVHFYVTHASGVLMDWCDFPDDPAWFSTGIDVASLSELARLSRGRLVTDEQP